MLTRKGNSLIMWVITFGIVTAVLALLRVPLKRTLATSMTGVTDYLIWRQWSQQPQEYVHDALYRSRGNATRSQTEEHLTLKGGVNKVYTGTASSENSVSHGVGAGSQGLLRTYTPP